MFYYRLVCVSDAKTRSDLMKQTLGIEDGLIFMNEQNGFEGGLLQFEEVNYEKY